MGKNAGGWVIFITALGMMCGLLTTDVAHLKTWGEFFTPSFIAVVMAHFATVVTAFLGGLQVTPSREGMQTRASDPKQKE